MFACKKYLYIALKYLFSMWLGASNEFSLNCFRTGSVSHLGQILK